MHTLKNKVGTQISELSKDETFISHKFNYLKKGVLK